MFPPSQPCLIVSLLPPPTPHLVPPVHPTLHPAKTNVFQILFHFVGSIFLSMFITQNWGYQALWPIIISCSFPPAFAEFAMFVRLNVMRIGPY